jgi:hypothetical protein
MRITEPLPFFHHSTFFLKFSLKILLYIFDYKSHAVWVWVWELKFNPTNQPTNGTTDDQRRAKRRTGETTGDG